MNPPRPTALLIFHDRGYHWLSWAMKRGFSHVLCAVQDERHWIVFDTESGVPTIRVAAAADYDLASFYRSHGFTVLAVVPGTAAPRGPIALANCVGLVKATLALSLPFAVTPHGLYRAIIRQAKRRHAALRIERRAEHRGGRRKRRKCPHKWLRGWRRWHRLAMALRRP